VSRRLTIFTAIISAVLLVYVQTTGEVATGSKAEHNEAQILTNTTLQNKITMKVISLEAILVWQLAIRNSSR